MFIVIFCTPKKVLVLDILNHSKVKYNTLPMSHSIVAQDSILVLGGGHCPMANLESWATIASSS
jgi:hypothetical protein